jgi:hypothetical protein
MGPMELTVFDEGRIGQVTPQFQPVLGFSFLLLYFNWVLIVTDRTCVLLLLFFWIFPN